MKNSVNILIMVILFIFLVIIAILYFNENAKVNLKNEKIKNYQDSIATYQSQLKALKLQKDSLDISLSQSLEELEEKKTQIKNLKKKLYAKADSVKHLSNDKSVEYLSKFLSKRGKAGE